MNENRDRRNRETQNAMRFAGLGMELAGSVLILAGIGYVVDQSLDNDRSWGVVVGALLGFGFGMFNLFRIVLKMNKSDQ